MSAVKSADRVCLILSLMPQQKDGLKHAEIAGTLKIPSSSLSSLLSTLVSRGFLSLDSRSNRYTLGPQVLMLAGEYLESVDIVKISRPVIQQVTAATGESTALGVKNGWEIVNLCKEDSHQLVKPTLQIGERSPLYASACGKAILAHMPEDEIEGYLSSVSLEPITPKTITNPKVLRAQLRRIRVKGVAYNREEISEQIIAVAAPVFDLYGSVNAALVVSFPIIRTSPKKEKSLEKIISEASRAVSEQLGFKGHFHHKLSKSKKDFKTKQERLPTFGLF